METKMDAPVTTPTKEGMPQAATFLSKMVATAAVAEAFTGTEARNLSNKIQMQFAQPQLFCNSSIRFRRVLALSVGDWCCINRTVIPLAVAIPAAVRRAVTARMIATTI